eukprot:4486938-Karenia_brevis.AAC.1
MGMNSSGALADVSNYQAMEKDIVVCRDACARWGIKFYCRCEDDALLIFDCNWPKIREFKEMWSNHSAIWRLDGWEFSITGVAFLDTFIFKSGSRMAYHTEWKDTSL